MRANTHVSSSVTDVVDILDVNYDDLFWTLIYYITKQRVCETISIIKMLTISKHLVWPRDFESFTANVLFVFLRFTASDCPLVVKTFLIGFHICYNGSSWPRSFILSYDRG
jgi:hypothetical protein